MYVDDDPEDRNLFEDALNSVASGCILTMAADGLDALQQLTDRDQPLPSLMVVDLNMPRMSGKELIIEIKSKGLFSELKLVVLTTSASPGDRAECARYGVDMHTKPVTFNNLKQTVSVILAAV